MDPKWPDRPATDQPTPPDQSPDSHPAPTPGGYVPGSYVPGPPAPGWFTPAPARVAEPRRPRVGLGIALIAVLLVAFFAGIAVDRSFVVATATASPTPGVANGAASEPPEFKAFWEAWDALHQHYVDQSALDAKKLTNGAINGMVDAVVDRG